MKIACVLVTHLPVKAEVRRNHVLRDRPFLVTTHASDGAIALDFSPQVTGVSSGMPLQEALSRCGGAVLIEADEVYYRQVFDRIVDDLHDKSPLIEKGEQGCVFLDMRGTEKMYGGDAGIVRCLMGAVPEDMAPRFGLAQSKFPSYVAAVMSRAGRATRVPKNVAAFLKDRSIELLPLPWRDLVRLHGYGIHTIGQVASIPIGSMQAQFGIQGRVAWNLASGIDDRPFVSSKQQEAVTDSLTFSVPITSLLAMLPAIEILLGRVLSHPSLRGKYLRSIFLKANVLNRSLWSKSFAFKSPVNRKESALFALRNSLEAIEFPGPLEDISVTVSDITGEPVTQSSMFVEVRKQRLREAMRQLEARLRVRPPVYKVIDVEPWSRIPERRQALVEFIP